MVMFSVLLWLFGVGCFYVAEVLITFHECDRRRDPYASDPWLIVGTYDLWGAVALGTVSFAAILIVSAVLARLTPLRFASCVAIGFPITMLAAIAFCVPPLLETPPVSACRL